MIFYFLLGLVIGFACAEDFSVEALRSPKSTAASMVAREFVIHGDPFRAVETLGKTENLKQIGVAMASAGLMDKLIGPLPTDVNPAASPSQLYSSFFKHELMKKCITTPLDVLILNKDLKDALVDSVKHAIVNAGANTLCYKIGQIYGAKKRDDAVTALDYALHKGSHAVVGFVSSAALGGNRNKHFGAGLGAMMAEVAAEELLPPAKELKAEKLALVDQEIARGDRDWDKIQERVTHTMNQRYGKEMAMAKVIGTTAGALFFKRDGAEGAQVAADRAIEYNSQAILRVFLTPAQIQAIAQAAGLTFIATTGQFIDKVTEKIADKICEPFLKKSPGEETKGQAIPQPKAITGSGGMDPNEPDHDPKSPRNKPEKQTITQKTRDLLGETDGFKKQLLERPGKPKTATTMRAAQQEMNGQQLQIAKDRGVTYDHISKVKSAQKGLIRHIEKIKNRLSYPNLPKAERPLLEKELSEASKLLDFSKQFVPKN